MEAHKIETSVLLEILGREESFRLSSRPLPKERRTSLIAYFGERNWLGVAQQPPPSPGFSFCQPSVPAGQACSFLLWESHRAGGMSASGKLAVWAGVGEVGSLTGTSALAALFEPALLAIKLIDWSLCDSCIHFAVKFWTWKGGRWRKFPWRNSSSSILIPWLLILVPPPTPHLHSTPLWHSWPVWWCLPCLDQSPVLVYVFLPSHLSYCGLCPQWLLIGFLRAPLITDHTLSSVPVPCFSSHCLCSSAEVTALWTTRGGSGFHKKVGSSRLKRAPANKNSQLSHSVMCSDMPNAFILGSLPLFHGKLSCLSVASWQSLAAWREVCTSRRKPASLLCLCISLLGGPRVALALRPLRGVHQDPFVGPCSSLHLGSGGRQIPCLSSVALLLGFCLNFSVVLQHDTFQNAFPALLPFLPPTRVPLPQPVQCTPTDRVSRGRAFHPLEQIWVSITLKSRCCCSPHSRALCPALFHLFLGTYLTVEYIPEFLVAPTQAAAQCCAFPSIGCSAQNTSPPLPPGDGQWEQGASDLEDKWEDSPRRTSGPGAIDHGSLLSSGLVHVVGGPAVACWCDQQGPEAKWTW